MTTRNINKEKRRQRILSAARSLLVDAGYDAFTTRRLAKRADLTVPTIYNLIGGKEDVLRTLVVDAGESFWNNISFPHQREDPNDVESFLNDCVDHVIQQPDVMRALVIASDRLVGAYAYTDQSAIDNAGASGVAFSTRGVRSLRELGLLCGVLSSTALGEMMFAMFRDAHRDWAYNLVDGEQFRLRFVRGALTLLCSDATDLCRQQWINRLLELDVGTNSMTQSQRQA